MNTDMLSSANHIVMIHRELLHPHPDNPRKDLGDLSELRDSILEHGIMQNLTIVPDGKDYKILIGHRRFAASEGILEDLPCVIVKGLSDREQLGIMLIENMQRSDLTYLEQAHGFQMMMDLGDTVETIAEKTGFSKATVKHRLAINEINPEALMEAQKSFQPTISDFILLEKVKDVEKRSDILKYANSSSEIQDEVDSYLEEIKINENLERYKKVMESKGWKEHKGWFNYYNGEYNRIDGMVTINLTEDYDDTSIVNCKEQKVYFCSSGWHLDFAVKAPKDKKKEAVKDPRLEDVHKRQNDLKQAKQEINDEFVSYIIKIVPQRFADLSFVDYRKFTNRIFNLMYKSGIYMHDFADEHTDDEELRGFFDKYLDLHLIQKMMLQEWDALDRSYGHSFYTWANYVERNEETCEIYKEFYDILYFFGFRFSCNKYLEIINGTSELYDKKEDNDVPT